MNTGRNLKIPLVFVKKTVIAAIIFFFIVLFVTPRSSYAVSPIKPLIQKYTITGFLYSDVNNNGVSDKNETPLSNATVEINKNGFISKVKTDSQGKFVYTSDVSGLYTLTYKQSDFSTPIVKSIVIKPNITRAKVNFGIPPLVSFVGVQLNQQVSFCDDGTDCQPPNSCYDFKDGGPTTCIGPQADGIPCDRNEQCSSGVCTPTTGSPWYGTCGAQQQSQCGQNTGSACCTDQTCPGNNLLKCGFYSQVCCITGTKWNGSSCASCGGRGQEICDYNTGNGGGCFGTNHEVAGHCCGTNETWNGNACVQQQQPTPPTSSCSSLSQNNCSISNVCFWTGASCIPRSGIGETCQQAQQCISPQSNSCASNSRTCVPKSFVGNSGQPCFLDGTGNAACNPPQVTNNVNLTCNPSTNTCAPGTTNNTPVPTNPGGGVITAKPTIPQAPTVQCNYQGLRFAILFSWTKAVPATAVTAQRYRWKQPGNSNYQYHATTLTAADTTGGLGGGPGDPNGTYIVSIGNKGSSNTGGNSGQNDGWWQADDRSVTVSCPGGPIVSTTPIPPTPTTGGTNPTITPGGTGGPTIQWVKPTANQTVSATIDAEFNTNASPDSLKIIKVCIDEKSDASCSQVQNVPQNQASAQVTFQFDTRTVANGPHSFIAVVSNTADTVSEKSINFTVQNAGQPTTTAVITNVITTNPTAIPTVTGTNPTAVPTAVITTVPTVTGTNPTITLPAGTPVPTHTGVITQIPTQVPSQTPVPTVTPTIPNTNVTLLLTLAGIGKGVGDNQTPKRAQREVEVFVLNTQQKEVAKATGTVSFNGTQYSGAIVIPNLPTGSYFFKVRFDNTLKKLVNTSQNPQQITAGTTVNFAVKTPVSGDLNQDNKLDIADFNILRNCYGAKICAQKIQSDLNDDGFVEEKDTNIFLRGITLTSKGD